MTTLGLIQSGWFAPVDASGDGEAKTKFTKLETSSEHLSRTCIVSILTENGVCDVCWAALCLDMSYLKQGICCGI